MIIMTIIIMIIISIIIIIIIITITITHKEEVFIIHSTRIDIINQSTFSRFAEKGVSTATSCFYG
jgi:hypothetical protein